jgi:hypothetical protein
LPWCGYGGAIYQWKKWEIYHISVVWVSMKWVRYTTNFINLDWAYFKWIRIPSRLVTDMLVLNVCVYRAPIFKIWPILRYLIMVYSIRFVLHRSRRYPHLKIIKWSHICYLKISWKYKTEWFIGFLESLRCCMRPFENVVRKRNMYVAYGSMIRRNLYFLKWTN